MMLHRLLDSVVPEALINRMRANPSLHRLRNGPAPRMSIGAGAGLAFYPGPSNSAYASGNNELPIQRALSQYVKDGAVFYDIGANVGFFTVIGAKLVGPSGRVYAFEPSPENATYVRLNARLNGFRNIHVVENAIASQAGEGDFWVAEYSGGAALALAGMPPDATRKISVQIQSVDGLVFQHRLPKPDLLKIDVEGAELHVMQGMTRTLHEVRPVLIYEIDDEKPEGFDRKYRACEQFIQSHGYNVQRLESCYHNTQWTVGHVLAYPLGSPSASPLKHRQ